jgi:hypothetical protein
VLIAGVTDHVGEWSGSNGFRLMPADGLAFRPARATLSASVGENLVSLAYAWVHPEDGPQDGLVMIGAGEGAGAAVALWGDSWHQQPQAMAMVGFVDAAGVHVEAEYAGGWRWRLHVDADGPTLRLRMENVVPEDQATAEIAAGPYEVMRMELHRST